MTPSTSSASRQRAVDQVRRDEWNAHDRSHTPTGKWIKGTRWSLLKSAREADHRPARQLGEVQQANKPLYRAFLLKEELRLLYQLDDPALAPAHLDAWLAWASRSRLEPFVKLARTIRRHRDGILAAIRLGLTNGRLEGLNSRIRLISHRSFGFHSAAPADRPRLPLLHRHHHPPPSMTFTPKPTGAPDVYRSFWTSLSTNSASRR